MAILFWVLFIVFFAISGYRDRAGIISYLPFWILIGILGLKVFGFSLS